MRISYGVVGGKSTLSSFFFLFSSSLSLSPPSRVVSSDLFTLAEEPRPQVYTQHTRVHSLALSSSSSSFTAARISFFTPRRSASQLSRVDRLRPYSMQMGSLSLSLSLQQRSQGEPAAAQNSPPCPGVCACGYPQASTPSSSSFDPQLTSWRHPCAQTAAAAAVRIIEMHAHRQEQRARSESMHRIPFVKRVRVCVRRSSVFLRI